MVGIAEQAKASAAAHVLQCPCEWYDTATAHGIRQAHLVSRASKLWSCASSSSSRQHTLLCFSSMSAGTCIQGSGECRAASMIVMHPQPGWTELAV